MQRRGNSARIARPHIAEMCKERIRRAGDSINGAVQPRRWNIDVGFRVLKIDTPT